MEHSARSRSEGSKRWLFRLASLVVAPVLMLGIAESGLRLVGYGHPTEFWIPTEEPGQLRSNARFGWRFFPPTMTQVPHPLVVANPRPPDRIRIVVFGGSAANGWPTPLFGFSRLLEVMLEERFPEADFEVINTAITAINSHAVLPIVRDSHVLDADLYVVYLGHNEVVGPFGAGSVVRGYQPSLGLIRASLAARTTRLGQLLEDLVRGLASNAETPSVWRGMEMFVEHEVAEHDPRLDVLQEHLRANLADIVDEAEEAQIPILLSLPLVNLRNLPPFASGSGPDVPRADRLEAREFVFRAKNLAAEHRDEVTVYLLEEAARLDPGHARTHFTLANALLAVGENDRAQAAFARARDLDRLRFRADTRTLDTITEIARERNVPLIDTPEFAREAHPSGIVGEELLLEHVHPNLEGHYAIARALFRPVVSQLADTGRLRSESNMTDAPALEVCTDRLGLTPAWITHAGRSALQTIASRPPFTPEWQEEALARWETRAGSIPDVLGAHATTDALAEALERHPEDLLAREALAGALAREDRGTESTQQLQSIIDAYPDWAWVRTRLARFRLAEGEHERAAQDASASLNVHPGDVEAWGVLAHALAAGDRLAEAIEAATRAVELAPERADTHFQIGRLLVRAERFEQAEDKLRVALKRSPDHPLALQQLARLAARDGRTTEAFNLAMLAARSAPNSVEILVDATRFALDAGRLEAARRSWQSATKLDSDLSRRFAGLAERVSRRARRVAPRPQNQ